MKVFLRLSFVGTAYRGYQVQPGVPTVQGALCFAAERLFGIPCDITGCSRTDSGVHARMFFVTVTGRHGTPLLSLPPVEKIPCAMNCYLPEDIAIERACLVPDDFHPRYAVKEKTYEYHFRFHPVRDPFSRSGCLQIPHLLTAEAFFAMETGAGGVVGTWDFSALMAAGSKIKDAVRTVREARLFREQESPFVVFRVSADGFLYNMVRIMAGTLLDVAEGRTEPDAIPDILAGKNRARAGKTVAPEGLYLTRVHYGLPDILPPDWEN